MIEKGHKTAHLVEKKCKGSKRESLLSIMKTRRTRSSIIRPELRIYYCIFCYKPYEIKSDARFEEHFGTRERLIVCEAYFRHVVGVRGKLPRGTNCAACNDCIYASKRSLELFEKLEVLKMKLRWQIESFSEMMKSAKTPKRLNAFRDGFKASMVDNKQDFDQMAKFQEMLLDAGKGY